MRLVRAASQTRHQEEPRQRRRRSLAGQVIPRPGPDRRLVRRHRPRHRTALRAIRRGRRRRRQARQGARRVGGPPRPGAVPVDPTRHPRPRPLRVRDAAGPQHRQPDAAVGRDPRPQRRHHGRTVTPQRRRRIQVAAHRPCLGAAARDRRRLRRHVARKMPPPTSRSTHSSSNTSARPKPRHCKV